MDKQGIIINLEMGSVLSITIMAIKVVLVAGVETRMCSESRVTVKLVRQCPLNKVEWEERELKLKCSERHQNCSSPPQFRYHCLRDSFGRLIELCAPSTTLKGKKCPEFNYGGERIQEENTGNCRSCPFSYSSNEVFNYSECLITSDVSTTSNSKNQTSLITDDVSTTSSSKNETKDESTETDMTLVIAACIAVVVLIVVVVVMVLVRKWCMRNQAPKKDMHNDEKQTMMVTCDVHELERNENRKDDEIVDVETLIESKELSKKRDDRHSQQELNEKRKGFPTLPDIYYKGKFSQTKGNEDGDP